QRGRDRRAAARRRQVERPEGTGRPAHRAGAQRRPHAHGRRRRRHLPDRRKTHKPDRRLGPSTPNALTRGTALERLTVGLVKTGGSMDGLKAGVAVVGVALAGFAASPALAAPGVSVGSLSSLKPGTHAGTLRGVVANNSAHAVRAKLS